MDTVLEFKNISFSYKNQEKQLLKNISFSLKQGEIISILGQSGLGKSTLLKLANRLLEHKFGQILYRNKDIRKIHPLDLRKKLAYLPQTPYLIPGDVKDNLNLATKLTSYYENNLIIQKMEDTLSDVGLMKDYLNKKIVNLSPGETQRVALARMLMLKDANVLLLDEPNASIDEHNTLILIKTLKKLAEKRSLSIIIVTHQSSFAKSLSPVSLILEQDGTIRKDCKEDYTLLNT